MYEPITVQIDRGYGEEGTYRSYTIRQSLWRNCYKYSDGLQSEAPLERLAAQLGCPSSWKDECLPLRT